MYCAFNGRILKTPFDSSARSCFIVWANNLLPVYALPFPRPVLGQGVLCSFAMFMHNYDSYQQLTAWHKETPLLDIAKEWDYGLGLTVLQGTYSLYIEIVFNSPYLYN